MLRFNLALLLCLGCSIAAYATDDEPVSPERPSLTNGTDTVALGHIQLETGYSFVHGSDGSKQQILGGGMQLRYPVAPQCEVRLGLPSYIWAQDSSGAKTSGLGDTGISAKYRFLEANAKHPIQPALAVIGGVELKTGDRDFREDDYQPSLALESDWSLTSALGLTGDVVYNGIRQSGQRFDEWAGGLCLNITLTPIWGTFGEIYHIADNGVGNSHVTLADTGLTYRVGANTIFDINTSVGLVGAKNSYSFGGGIARRW